VGGANLTNFEDGDPTKIENSMNQLIGNKSVDISERCYILSTMSCSH
jgi:hypothetical protein